jgi:hypothetical protein
MNDCRNDVGRKGLRKEWEEQNYWKGREWRYRRKVGK